MVPNVMLLSPMHKVSHTPSYAASYAHETVMHSKLIRGGIPKCRTVFRTQSGDDAIQASLGLGIRKGPAPALLVLAPRTQLAPAG